MAVVKSITLCHFGIRAVEAIPALIQTLKDENQWVCGTAAEAFRIFTGQDFGEEIKQWKQCWEGQG